MTLFAVCQPIVDTQDGVSDPRSSERAADYQTAKESQQCTYPRCGKPPAQDTQLCARHLANKRTNDRTSLARRREDLAARGRCVDCRKKSSTYRCAGCAVKRGRIPTTGVGNGVGNEASKIPAQWRLEPGTTWNRYRGKAKRGKPSTAILDDQDLEYAVEEITTAKLALAYARSPEVQQMPKAQRDDIMAAALARLDRAERWLDEVRVRHKPRGSR